ncbi:MAG: iron-sulfur cluster assembly accessory protein [Rhizobacter sp.]|nr:iron-sulfur cluster assembly accessory protein [Chlorobiales bacterium]
MSTTAELTAPEIATTPGVTLSAAAAGEVKNIVSKNSIPENYRLRIGVTGGGCSGMSYALGFDTPKEGDETFVSSGIEVVVDQRHLMYLSGITIDFADGLQGRGFTFNNPNATKTCGCGSSFSA